MKHKAAYQCQTCGAVAPKCAGQCADCGAWNTLIETVVATAPDKRGRAAGAHPPARLHTLTW